MSVLPNDIILDVLIVGAGLSGIGAAYHLQKNCPSKRFVIVEARQSLGGTWDLFRYPGVRSDSDMYTLAYDFKPWTATNSIADGAAILAYIKETAEQAGIVQHIRFGHRVISAAWSSLQACWTVELAVRNASLEVVETEVFHCRFLHMCSGYYDYEQGHRPEFACENDFGGTIIHPQFWPQNLDLHSKRVVVIGSGATAITLVPALVKVAAQVTMLQRSPSYVVTRPTTDARALLLQKYLPAAFAFAVIRWINILETMLLFQFSRLRPQQAKRFIVAQAALGLGPTIDTAKHFTPKYNPWDQRVCVAPDGDLFETLRTDQATVETDEVERFTRAGVLLRSGRELAADIIVVATGLKLKMMGGATFAVDGVPAKLTEALMYRGMMLSDLPNCLIAFGYTNASWTLKTDLTSAYFCRLMNYMDKHNYAIAVPRRNQSVESLPFINFTSGYIQRATDVLPKQGSKRPWQVYQNYLQDLLSIRHGRLADGVMRFGPAGEMP